MEEGIVYVLKNPAMPGLVKIGITTRAEVHIRMSELYTTGVPLPFECSFAGKVKNVKAIESALHLGFDKNRINQSREFFSVEDYSVVAILKHLVFEEVTPELNKELENVDEKSRTASKDYKRTKRANFNFQTMGINVGAILTNGNGTKTCIVENDKQVRFEGEVLSFTAATKKMLNAEYDIAPTFIWYFEGRRLRDIYNEIY
jgi:hypothetical protein